MAATRLYKTYGSEADSKTKLTFSAWIKRSGLGATQDVFSAFRASDGYQTDIIRFGSDDRFEFWSFNNLIRFSLSLIWIIKFESRK